MVSISWFLQHVCVCVCKTGIRPATDTLTMSSTPPCTSLTALTPPLPICVSPPSPSPSIPALASTLALSFWPQEITLTPPAGMLPLSLSLTHTHKHSSIYGPVYVLISSPGPPWLPLIHRGRISLVLVLLVNNGL